MLQSQVNGKTYTYQQLRFYGVDDSEWKQLKIDATEQGLPLYKFLLSIYDIWRQAKLSHEQGGENATS